MDEYVRNSQKCESMKKNHNSKVNQNESHFSLNSIKKFDCNEETLNKTAQQNVDCENFSECGNCSLEKNPINYRKQIKNVKKDYHSNDLSQTINYRKKFSENNVYSSQSRSYNKPMAINQHQSLIYPTGNRNRNINEPNTNEYDHNMQNVYNFHQNERLNNKYNSRSRINRPFQFNKLDNTDHSSKGNFPHTRHLKVSIGNQDVFENNKKSKHRVNKKTFPINNYTKPDVNLNQRDSLIWQLNHNKYECMICVTNIRPETQTWSCENCYHIFHIHCIKKWATTCGNTDDRDDSRMNLRCPACQKEYSINVNKTVDESKGKEWIDYLCFCGKQINPTFKKGSNITPHSCDDVCSKPNRNNDKCPHLCSLMCHPGPCPPCEAIVTRQCQCQRTNITTKCTADERSMVCGEKCEKHLNCGVHQCDQLCHAGECNKCGIESEQECWCDRKTVRIVICGGAERTQEKEDSHPGYSCDNVCSRTLECGNHQCEQKCHFGDCMSCSLTVDKISRCWCKKMSIDELDASCQRKSCIDPVPSCGEICERIIDSCGHVCSRICHEGECGPCPSTRDVVCRCGKTTHVGLACSSIAGAGNEETNGGFVLCNKVCNKKLSCGRHRCNEKCCMSELHLCFRPCGRTLTCKSHQCEHRCGHVGLCPSCPNVSFDELHCECGAATLLPPIACGQSPPICDRTCSRDHECPHPVRHNCHSESTCPPCTELTKKSCPGNHKILENVYCFRPVATCGLPCGRSLECCEHSCNRICHQGECLISNTKCSQPCIRLRMDCGHPCSAPCHDNDCQEILSNCMFEVILICSCKTRSISMACYKLQNTISLIKFNANKNSDLILSSRGNSASLPCDNECRKNTRDLKLAEAFDVCITTSSLNTHYSDSIKNFFKKNVEFLIQTEKILLDLTKHAKSNVEFKNYTGEKADFINRYAACFKLIVKCTQNQNQKHNVIVEFNRSNSCIPKPLLSELLKIECPHLFPSQTEIEKNKVSTTNLAMSFADKIRFSKRE